MTFNRRQFLGMAGGLPVWERPARSLTADDPLLLLLSRTSWGVLPQDFAWAGQIGYEAYLEEQLHPERLNNTALEAMLAQRPILQMSRAEAYFLNNTYGRTARALIEGMIIQARHSTAQLQERMVDFWTDHFQIAVDELAADLIPFHREGIRRHALGNFRAMLFASAYSPAMLTYLDNALNIAEHPNENYARELLELHTLGVDGGYTERDVKEVARAFTGWTVNNASPDGFYFDPSQHDSEEKLILGHRLPAGRGLEDGLHVLSLLAEHPSTARFLSFKLCRRFVADTPPESLVNSTAQVWMETGGEIRPVLRHIFLSAEFLASAGQKLRRPLEFFIGALRATGAEFEDEWVWGGLLEDLGQVPYSWRPPDGYPDVALAWKTSHGLLARWNTASFLCQTAASEADSGARVSLFPHLQNPQTLEELVDQVTARVFGRPAPDPLRAELLRYASDEISPSPPLSADLLAQKLGGLFALALASPQYQWH
jgi:uncharacterized protein (DUF1800 family)